MAKNVGDFFGNFFENLWKGVTDLGNTIGGFFSDLSEGVGGYFDDLWNDILEFFQDLPQNISNIWTDITSILSYINPFSDNFFLKIAFVMNEEQEATLENNKNEIQEKLNTKFPLIQDFQNDLQNAIDKQNNFRQALANGLDTNSNPLNIEIPEYNYSSGSILVNTNSSNLMNILVAYEPYRQTIRNGLVLIVYGLGAVYIIKFLLNYGVTDTVGFVANSSKGGDDD